MFTFGPGLRGSAVNPNTVLDFNGIGADGSTDFFDLSPFNSTVQFSGAVVKTNAPLPSGSASTIEIASNGYVSLPASATRYALGAQEHTFEGYFWFGNTGNFQTMLACIDAAGSAFDFRIGAFSGGFAAPGYLLHTSGGTLSTSTGLVVPLTTLVHIAFCRQNGGANDRMWVYLNGVVQGSAQNITSGVSVNNNTSATVDCGQVRYLSQRRMSGRAQGVRLVIGQCLYPDGTTFTPPALPYTY